VAFKRGARGRAYTARLKRRSLADVTRIGPAPDGPRDASQFDVAISPNGKRVAWVGIDDAIERPGQIVLFDARASKLAANLSTGSSDSGPVFSPDGKRVAFTRGSSIWTVPAKGGVAKRLVARGTQPAWGR
jgi:Tol biopolymer transport system component